MGGPGFVPTFLFYFVGTILIAGFVSLKGEGSGLDTIDSYWVVVAFGILAGLVGAYFNSHREIAIPIKNRGAFTKQLKDTLARLSYAEKGELDEFTVYERPLPSNLFSGKLFIKLDKAEATISGRSVIIRALQKQFEQ